MQTEYLPQPMTADPAGIERFIARWTAAGGSERANYQLFVGELCRLNTVAHFRGADHGSRHA